MRGRHPSYCLFSSVEFHMSFFRQDAAGAPTGLAVVEAGDLRMGGGKSIGSRGSRTYAAPPATKIAFRAAPVARSMTDKPKPGPAPDTTFSSAAALSLLAGWRGALMGSLIAICLGSIFGFGTVAGVIGVLLQFALVGGVLYFVVNFIRSRALPASAPDTNKTEPGNNAQNRSTFTFSSGPAPLATELTVSKDDLDSFERLLEETLAAYSREDVDELGARTTPEMLSYLSMDLHDNEKKGLRSDASDIKLLRGNIAEAWRENCSDYATVAMCYLLVATTVDRKSGEVVAGDPSQSSQATELWTFRRDDRARDEGWQLSAIQQAVSPSRAIRT